MVSFPITCLVSGLKGYGFINGDTVIEINRYRLVFKRIGKGFLYERIDGEKHIVSKIVKEPVKSEIIPLYPVFVPSIITKYVMVKLTQSLILSHDSKTTIYVKIPVDIGVYTYGPREKYSLIDVFGVDKVKYALYGPVAEGLITRYYESKPYLDMINPSLGEAVAKLVIENRSDSLIELGRVVLDSQILKLHYKPGTWEAYTQEIHVSLLSQEKAYVTYGSPFLEGLVEINDPEGFKPPKLKGGNEMLWGVK